jgi:hypothetical protein
MDTSSTERFLTGVWLEVLELEALERTDHLLDLGGNSLMATMIANRVEVAWGFRPSMSMLMSLSLAELAEACEEERLAATTEERAAG